MYERARPSAAQPSVPLVRGFERRDSHKKVSGGEARGRTSLICVLARSSRLPTLLMPMSMLTPVLSACGPNRKRKLAV